MPTGTPTTSAHRLPFPEGLLVYSYYYAEDVPRSIQRRANILWVCCFAMAGTAARIYVGHLASLMGMAAPGKKLCVRVGGSRKRTEWAAASGALLCCESEPRDWRHHPWAHLSLE